MEIEYARSFLWVYKKLDTPVKEGIKETTQKIITYYATGHKTLGLGIRNLRGDIWEGRYGLQVRVISLLGFRSYKVRPSRDAQRRPQFPQASLIAEFFLSRRVTDHYSLPMHAPAVSLHAMYYGTVKSKSIVL